MVEFHIGAVQPGKDIPVNEPDIISRRVVPVIGELDAAASFAGQMLSPPLVGEAAAGIDPEVFQSAEHVIPQKRRQLRSVQALSHV
jgi:hypothetical protein